MAADKEMEMLFKSSRAQADPVSGNEVPTGSLPEEVRDDIPAQLSEGEYVVPADVVRYYGVKFFEDLRSQAKMGWQDMEENGRIGGEPIPSGMEMGNDELPFDINELQVEDDDMPEMAEGGFVQGYADGNLVTSMGSEYPGTIIGTPTQGVQPSEFRTFRNAAGLIINIRFIDGKPVTPIPEGYTEVSSQQEVASAVAQQVSTNNNDDDDGPDEKPKVESIDWDTVEPEVIEKYVNQLGSPVGKGAQALAGAINPLIGVGIGAAMRHQNKKVLTALDTRIAAISDANDPTRLKLEQIRENMLKQVDKNDDGKVDTIVERSGIYGGESSLYENLQDTNGDGKVSFADTWLGDLLGLDGEAGVQGPSLEESRAGARRQASQDDNDSGPVIPTTPTQSRDSSPVPVLRPSTPAPTPTPEPVQSTPTTTSNVGQVAQESYKKQESEDFGLLNKGGLMMKKNKRKKKK